MFAQRFDPSAFESETKKRRLSGSDVSDSDRDSKSSSSENSDSSDEDMDESDDSSSQSSDEQDEHEADVKTSTDNNADSDNEDDSDDISDKDTSSNSIGAQNNKSSKQSEDSDSDMEVDEDYVSRHLTVFSKFKRTMEHQPQEEQEELSEEEVQQIAPMPQPELPRDEKLKISGSNNLDWLAKPVYSKPGITKAFSDFVISTNMHKNLSENGYTEAFSVQITVLEMMLQDVKENQLKPDSNGDILVNASTGSGKTLAYLIPIIEALSTRIVPRTRAIVLVPTKPLINQVKQTFLQLSKGTNLYVSSLRSDILIKEEGTKLIENPPDIIISTPGRLVDHVVNGSVDLKSLRYLVIDEADRLLNQLFQNWCNILISKLESTSNPVESWKLRVQKLIFSATLTTDAGKLSLLKLYKHRLIIINDREKLVNELYSTPATLSEYVIRFGSNKSSLKPMLLANFLVQREKNANVLVFTKSNEASIRLAKLLEILLGKIGKQHHVEYLNSTNNTLAIRKKLLKSFESGEVSVLVVTDLIARGIDISSITDVINYDLPNSSREYVHRVGRTARANNSGNAYNFVFGKGENNWFWKLMKDVSREKEIEELKQIPEGEEILQQGLVELQQIMKG